MTESSRSIGTASDSAIRIPGAVTQGSFAQICLLDARPFVQLTGSAEVLVNGDRFAGTRWLEQGDQVQIGGVVIDCAVRDESLLIDVTYRDQEFATTPPVTTLPVWRR